MQNKKSWFDELHYKFDKQRGNLEFMYLVKGGKPKWKEWKTYLEVQGNDKLISEANNRRVLPNEVPLDIEDPKKFPEILERVKKDFDFYSAYKTGSKGYHIHLWFNEKLIPSEKLEIIKKYGADEQKASERCMIALENVPHWKTGNSKELILEKKGINRYVKRELTEAEKLENLRESCLSFEYDQQGNVKKIKVLIPNVVGYLLKQYNFKTIFGSKSEEIFVYQDGIYTKHGREIIQTQTEKILGEHCSNHYVKEIEEKIKRSTAISKGKFDDIPEELICLMNGILNLKTQELLDYDPKYYFKNKIPIEYNKKAACPKIKKFLKEVLYPEDIKVMQEWFCFDFFSANFTFFHFYTSYNLID